MSISITNPGHGSVFLLSDLIEIKGTANGGVTNIKLESPFGGKTYPLNQIPVNDDGTWGVSTFFNTGGDRTIVAKGFDDSDTQLGIEQVQIKLKSYTDLVSIRPLPVGFNAGLSSAKESTMLSILGKPCSPNPSVVCSTVNNTKLKTLLVTKNVGLFRVTGLIPAVDALERIFSKVKVQKPILHAQLGTAGMLCCRFIKNTTKFSNHSWGTAIDIKISSDLDAVGDGKAQLGLVEIAPYFNAEEFFWGAGFSSLAREDSMHFEASEQLIQKWHQTGIIP
jgi:hypothetical protein